MTKKATVFNKKQFNTVEENMFFGEDLGIARFDIQRYPIFEKNKQTYDGFLLDSRRNFTYI